MQGLLKFITCGSVDDGKSTLIGHMLYDAKLIFADQEKAMILDSRIGSREGQVDYSLLLDGLMAEREQGITIDVAYRYFSTEQRSFIVADTPGHEQYTRNMAVGASYADLAVILVDATQGVLLQTRRHAQICALMGIRHFVVAVNKMDLIHFDHSRFQSIKAEVMKLMSDIDVQSCYVLPVSATEGDNITRSSKRTPWHEGQPLLAYLETVNIDDCMLDAGFVMPVQRVSRPHLNYRGFQGEVEAGSARVGDEVVSLPSLEKAKIKSILAGEIKIDEARKGQSVSIQLDREVDISRGCVIKRDFPVQVADQFTATILWMDEMELVVGRNYWIKVATKVLPATIMSIKHKVDVNTGMQIATDRLFKNEIAVCDFTVSERLAFTEFKTLKAMGSLILIDRVTHMTSACGVIEHALRRSTNVIWHQTEITREMRAAQKAQKPITLWFTGLSGSGKSTVANAVEKRLVSMGKHTMLLDGDNIRHGLNRNLGFKEADRVENIRRIAEVSKLLNEAGLIVLTSFISPYRADRQNAREIIGDGFVEIYVSTPLEVCEERDVKGLYQKARAGEIPNFTGITDPYENPEKPAIEIDTQRCTLEEAVERILGIILPII